MRLRAVAVGTVLAVEIAIALILAILALALMTWIVVPETAADMSSSRWWWVSGRRLVPAALLALVVGGVAWTVNREVTRDEPPSEQRLGRWVAAGSGGLIALAAVGGALWFALAHPTG